MCRREFLGGCVATVAAQGLAAGVKAFETPRLKVGVLSDVHIKFYGMKPDAKPSTDMLDRALRFYRARNVDAVVIAGDLTEFGEIAELEELAKTWNTIFPDNRGADGKIVERLFIRGNHEHMKGRSDHVGKVPLIKDDPAGAFKRLFAIDDYAEMRIREVRGYKFLMAEWGAQARVGEWFKTIEPTLPKDKPFFWIQHNHPKGTNIKPDIDITGQSTEALSRWPNAVALSGHSHYPLAYGDQIWQGAFTAVGTSSLDWLHIRKDRAENAFGTGGWKEGLYMEVFDDRIVFERLNFVYQCKIGPDWVVPLDGSRPYAWDKQKAERLPPEFPAQAKLKVERKGEELVIEIPRTLPANGDDGRTVDYEIVAFRPEDGEQKPLQVRHVYAEKFTLPDDKLSPKQVVKWGLDKLGIRGRVRFAVKARNTWERAGRPIYGECTVD